MAKPKIVEDVESLQTEVTNARDGELNLKAKIDKIDTNIGDLTTLDTTNKTNLVSATNEVVSQLTENTQQILDTNTNIGDLTTLNTTSKILVSATNEVVSRLDDKEIQISDIIAKANNFVAKINSGNAIALGFAQFKTALTAGTINVCVIGDSISTESPNTITPIESYYKNLRELLYSKYPTKTFNFTNLAIGGTIIQEWNLNKTFNSVTKTWIEHVKDSNPDLLIIAWGMNNGSYASAKQFKYNLKSILDYITANFTKQPSIAVVTTPVPTQNGTYSTTEAQESRNTAAYTARTYGYTRNCYVIDVNRFFNIKRNGIDVKDCYAKALALSDAAISPLTTGTYTKNGTEYSLQTNGQYLNLNTQLKNFKISFDVKFQNFPVGEENLIMYYNYNSMINAIYLLPNKTSTSVGCIKSYGNFTDSDELGVGETAIYNSSATWSDSVYRTIFIQKVGDLLEIFVNGVSVLRDKIQINNVAGYIQFYKSVGSTGVATLQNIKIYECKEKEYMQSLTDANMWGTYIEGDANTKSPYGGNGINHPTTIGLQEVYMPSLREFVMDLPNS